MCHYKRFKYAAEFIEVMGANAFLEFVGDTPINRLLDFLITGRDFDYTLTNLANKSGVSWSTLHRIFPHFVKNEIVKLTREVGRARLYRINADNIIVTKFIALYDTIIIKELEKAQEELILA